LANPNTSEEFELVSKILVDIEEKYVSQFKVISDGKVSYF
jgi:hypothetical protein